MEPKEVLELIHAAPEPYDSVHAALRYRGDGPMRKEIRERIARTEAGRRAFDLSPQEASEWIERSVDYPEPEEPYG